MGGVTWSFDISWSTHDALKAGITELGYNRVVVAADSHDEAALIACQMVACHGMPTALYDRI